MASPRAGRETIRNAVRYSKESPQLGPEDLASATGVSETTAKRILAGEHDQLLDEAPASTVTTPKAPKQPGSRSDRVRSILTPRRPRKSKAPLAEPDPESVDAVYAWACSLTAILMAPLPESYQFTTHDREYILGPLTRMYLRRKSIPEAVKNPDARDFMMLGIGLYGYGTHALAGRYVGRDAVDRYGRATARTPGVPAGAGSPPPADVPGGGAGASNGAAGGQPGDPDALMAWLEKELGQTAAPDVPAEPAAASGADASGGTGA